MLPNKSTLILSAWSYTVREWVYTLLEWSYSLRQWWYIFWVKILNLQPGSFTWHDRILLFHDRIFYNPNAYLKLLKLLWQKISSLLSNLGRKKKSVLIRAIRGILNICEYFLYINRPYSNVNVVYSSVPI